MIHNQLGAEGPRDLDHGTTPPDGRSPEAQPKWRRDFPIDLAQDEYVTRRELVKFIVLTSAAMVVGQLERHPGVLPLSADPGDTVRAGRRPVGRRRPLDL